MEGGEGRGEEGQQYSCEEKGQEKKAKKNKKAFPPNKNLVQAGGLKKCMIQADEDSPLYYLKKLSNDFFRRTTMNWIHQILKTIILYTRTESGRSTFKSTLFWPESQVVICETEVK